MDFKQAEENRPYHVVLSRPEGVQQIIARFDKKINQIFSGGDPVVAQWFLVRETYLPILLCGFYILFCTVIGPAIMRNKKPFDLRIPMVAFNFSLVAAYTFCFIKWAVYVQQVTWHDLCIGAPVKGVFYKLATLAWFIYIIKYVEFFDTVFFVLRKKTKQMSLLHIVHHTIVPLLGWSLLRTETNGLQSFPVVINTIVHIIMYTYYGLAAMGPWVHKYLWWKKYLTQLQLVQFLLMFIFATVIAPLTGCPVVTVGNMMFICTAFMFFYLFYQFYQNTFQQKKD